ncbi:MAG TPA: SH3 domain-containing protein [Gemmatimonadaceae bacterium]|nr:SH3 domain-containing protein [Gemmatimonadaceae bacterium]
MHHSPALPATRAALALALLVAAPPLAAQATLRRGADLLATPGGRALASLLPGASVRPGTQRGDYALVTVDGFVSAALLGPGRDSFPVTAARSGTRLRSAASPDAPVVAELRAGMGLARVARAGAWVRVRRTAWVERRALETATAARQEAAPRSDSASRREGARGRARTVQVATGEAARPAQRPAQTADGTARGGAASAADAPARAGDVVTATRATALAEAPNGRSIARLEPGARATPLATERDWIRVRVEGWVRDRDLAPADSSLRTGLSAADLRADPAGTRGRVVRWEVQVIAFQVADPLRRDMVTDEPYLLARGPSGENSLLYLALPPSLVDLGRALPPLTTVMITARVRNGRSEPVGVPVLDLQTLTRR